MGGVVGDVSWVEGAGKWANMSYVLDIIFMVKVDIVFWWRVGVGESKSIEEGDFFVLFLLVYNLVRRFWF